jgi:hypothetical protein
LFLIFDSEKFATICRKETGSLIGFQMRKITQSHFLNQSEWRRLFRPHDRAIWVRAHTPDLGHLIQMGRPDRASAHASELTDSPGTKLPEGIGSCIGS